MKAIAVERAVAEEIEAFARRAGRSTGFVVRRALAAARETPPAAAAPADGEQAKLELTLDDEDDPKTRARIAELCAEAERRGAADPGGALADAWRATRARFLGWLEKQEQADRAAQADDLDRALDEAAARTTAPERLAELAASDWVQVRARAAKNPRTPAVALERLAAERERLVRAALRENPALPAALRERLAG